jgi:hypothetical protein
VHPAQWIAAWDAVQAQIDGNGAGAYASWMWAPNADTGAQSGSGWGLGNFREPFGQSFTKMRSLTSLRSSSPRPTWPRSALLVRSSYSKRALFTVLATSLDDDPAAGSPGG